MPHPSSERPQWRLSRSSGFRRALAVGLLAALTLGAADPAEAKRRKGRKGAAASAADARRKPSKQALRYSRRGKKEYLKGRWDSAIAAFELAYREDPLARFLHNIGRCYEMKGDLLAATDYLERYLKAETHERDRQDGLETLAILQAKLSKTHRRVRIVVMPETATVRLSRGETVLEGAVPLERWLTEGRWSLTASAAGWQTHERELALDPGGPLDVALVLERPPPVPETASVVAPKPELQPQAHPQPAPAPAPESAEEDVAGGSGVRWPAWAALWSGVALLAGGAVLGISTNAAKDARDGLKGGEPVPYAEVEQHQADAETRSLWTNLLLAGGGAAALTGAVLLLVLDDAPGQAGTGPALAPLGDSEAGLLLRGSW